MPMADQIRKLALAFDELGVKPEHIELSQKVGIRSQLFNRQTERLEDDFLCLPGPSSTHVLNAISPAFTASFALADLIIDQALPALKLG